MSSSMKLVDGLKRELKARGITYAELARRIGMSEASVKRMFAQRSFTLQRLDEVLAAAGIDLLDLTRSALEAPRLIAQLSYAQEEELIGDPKLLLVAVAALNGVPVDELVATFAQTQAEAVKHLLRLVSVMLSPSSTAALLERLRQVADDFSQQHQADARLPYEARQSMTFLLAARPWMPEAFAALRRETAVSGATRPALAAAPRRPASSNGRRSSR
jgi:transcriptional regulator with XRE-family HTH domain